MKAKRTALFTMLAFTAAVGTANAATLVVTSDKASYTVGETIALTIMGDDGGASSYGIFGRLLYDGAFVDNLARTQTLISGPLGSWAKGVLNAYDSGSAGSFSYAFSQIAGLYAQTANNLPGTLSTVTLVAKAVGVVNVSWDTAGGATSLDFFGLPYAPGISFVILPTLGSIPIPEPGTVVLVGFGLVGLAMRDRARLSRRSR